MKRFLVAIIVILMSTVAFAGDKLPRAGFINEPGVDPAEVVSRAALEAKVQMVVDAASLFPPDKTKEAFLALAKINGLYVGETSDGCSIVSDNEDAVRREEAAQRNPDKLPPGGGGSCYISYCTASPAGPYAMCQAGGILIICYDPAGLKYACCGWTGSWPAGSGVECGYCLYMW